jgi:hypothetical protein
MFVSEAQNSRSGTSCPEGKAERGVEGPLGRTKGFARSRMIRYVLRKGRRQRRRLFCHSMIHLS